MVVGRVRVSIIVLLGLTCYGYAVGIVEDVNYAITVLIRTYAIVILQIRHFIKLLDIGLFDRLILPTMLLPPYALFVLTKIDTEVSMISKRYSFLIILIDPTLKPA